MFKYLREETIRYRTCTLCFKETEEKALEKNNNICECWAWLDDIATSDIPF